MDCTEQAARTFDTLKKMTSIGLGDAVIGILNYHPEIKSNDKIPGSEQTLYDYIVEKYPDTGVSSPRMPKNTLLEISKDMTLVRILQYIHLLKKWEKIFMRYSAMIVNANRHLKYL